MDVAWCLTCSKRTVSLGCWLFTVDLHPNKQHSARDLYCSEVCRTQDQSRNEASTSASPPAAAPMAISSTLPPIIPLTLSKDRSISPVKHAVRPPVTPLHAPESALTLSKPATRDRRAYSFPAQMAEPVPIAKRRRDTRQSMIMPRFARKSTSVALSCTTTPILTGIREGQPRAEGFAKLAKSTGANTPAALDSVFCSTSESSDNELAIEIGSPQSSFPAAMPMHNRKSLPLPVHHIEHSSIPTSQLTLKSHLSPSHLSPRKSSQSPVAALVASSASSRSREDIISWAKAVKLRPDESSTSEDERPTARPRGRSRTRKEMPIYEPTQDGADEAEGDTTGPGTTPKGRIEYALAGLSHLSAFGVGPLVKVLSSVTASTAAPPATSSLGLQSVPAVPEVSRVQVLASPINVDDSPVMPSYMLGTGTPTLSTVSFSEAIDPSIMTDPVEQADIFTDDQSAASSSAFARRFSTSAKPYKAAAPQPPVARTSAVYRPISTLFNLSAYLRSFSPFALAPPQPAATTSPTPPVKFAPSVVAPSPSKLRPTVAPMPATSRPQSPEETPAQQMVRSLPMDIVLPPGGEEVIEQRQREREVRQWIERSRSRRSKSPPRSPMALKPESPSPAPSRDESPAKDVRHARHWSYDADESDEGDEERRGRSRRGKVITADVTPVPDTDSRGRSAAGSRTRDGRGRDRTVRAAR